VALQIVEPVVSRQSLRITADARHFDALVDYLEQLQARSLTNVVLISHQIQAQQPGTPIRFQVQAKWGTPSALSRISDARPSAQGNADKRALETSAQNGRSAIARGQQ